MKGKPQVFDIRRIQVHSLKEFFKEFAMIVIGILTAITIEHQYTQSHKRHLAEKAAQHVRTEIAANLKLAEESILSNEQTIQVFKQIEQQIVNDLESKQSKEEIIFQLQKHMDGHYGIGAYVIEPAQDAWDAAIASQAVAQMNTQDLQAFSRLYAKQRAVTTDLAGFQQAMRAVTWIRWNGAITDLQFKRAEPVEFLKVLREFLGNLDVLNNKIKSYKTALQAVNERKDHAQSQHD
jgi:hypothetical protein